MSRARSHTVAWRQFASPGLLAWALYLFLFPIYIFKSGLPQPGDLFIVLLVPIALHGWNGRLSSTLVPPMRALAAFTLWVCLVNLAWATITGNFGVIGPATFLMFPLYYVYNALLVLVALVLYQRYGERFLHLTIRIIYLTIAVQVLSAFLLHSTARNSLFFNNPNQLGYFALLASCVVVLLRWRLQLRLLSTSLALTGCGYIAVVSASRAAMAGVAVLFALLLFSNPKVILAASVAVTLLLLVGGPVSEALDSTEVRIRNRTSQVSFFEERGYDRILTHKHYLVFGAGEGGFTRFAESRFRQMEIHSSVGTIVFSYGLVGVVLFLVFVRRLLRRAPIRQSLVLLPPLLYGMSHQGLRFSLLWVLFALFLALKDLRPPSPLGSLRA